VRSNNPFRSEGDAFRFLLLVIGFSALIVIARLINVWLGLAVFIVESALLGGGSCSGGREEPPVLQAPPPHPAGERRILVIAKRRSAAARSSRRSAAARRARAPRCSWSPPR